MEHCEDVKSEWQALVWGFLDEEWQGKRFPSQQNGRQLRLPFPENYFGIWACLSGGCVLVYHAQSPGVNPSPHRSCRSGTQAWNLSIAEAEAEAEALGVQSPPQLPRVLKTVMSYMKPHLCCTKQLWLQDRFGVQWGRSIRIYYSGLRMRMMSWEWIQLVRSNIHVRQNWSVHLDYPLAYEHSKVRSYWGVHCPLISSV